MVGDGVSEELSRVKVGKDAVSSLCLSPPRGAAGVARALFGGKGNPYLYLDATYLKVRWGSSVSSLPLLACVGVEDTGSSQR